VKERESERDKAREPFGLLIILFHAEFESGSRVQDGFNVTFGDLIAGFLPAFSDFFISLRRYASGNGISRFFLLYDSFIFLILLPSPPAVLFYSAVAETPTNAVI